MISIKDICEEYQKNNKIPSALHRGNATVTPVFSEAIQALSARPQLICIGSRPGMGRTALLLDLILKTAITDKKTVLFFLGGTPFEDDLGLLADRLLRRLCGANVYSIVKNANPCTIYHNTQTVPSALALLKKLPIYFDTKKHPSAEHVRAGITALGTVGLAVVGNAEYIVPENKNKGEMADSIKELMEGLSRLTKETGTSIALSTTLTRCIELRSDKRPYVRDLKSGHLRRLSDTVVLLYRDAYYTLEKDDSAEIVIAQNATDRYGRSKMHLCRQSLHFDYNKICFAEA